MQEWQSWFAKQSWLNSCFDAFIRRRNPSVNHCLENLATWWEPRSPEYLLFFSISDFSVGLFLLQNLMKLKKPPGLHDFFNRYQCCQDEKHFFQDTKSIFVGGRSIRAFQRKKIKWWIFGVEKNIISFLILKQVISRFQTKIRDSSIKSS